jgi:GH18 family chitinase
VKDQIVMLLLGLLIALGGWTMTQTFSLSTTQAVLDDKVDKLENQVEKLIDEIDGMKDLDEDIVEQHDKFIRLLESNNSSTQPSTYSY